MEDITKEEGQALLAANLVQMARSSGVQGKLLSSAIRKFGSKFYALSGTGRRRVESEISRLVDKDFEYPPIQKRA